MRAASGVSALAALAACVETIPVPIEAEPGDVVIVAATNPAGAVVATQLTDFGAPEAIALPRDATVVSWVLPRGSLIDEDGTPLTSRDGLSVRIVDPNRPNFTGAVGRETGSCGRCLAPSGEGPQILFEGDSCAVPRFARATGDQAPGTLTSARRQIRLERTGACPCVPHEPGSAGSVALRAIQPAQDPWPYDVYAQAPDGTLGIFSQHEIILASPDGTRRRRTQQDESRYCGGAPADLPFVGPIIAAVGLPEGRYLLASHDPEKEAVQSFFVVEPDLTVNLVTTNLALMRAKKMVRFDDSGDLYLFGESRRTQPAVMRCTYRPSEFQLTCEVITPEDFLAKDNFVPTAVTDDGVLVTYGIGQGWVYGPATRARPSTFRVVPTSLYPDGLGGVVSLTTVSHMIAAGSRVYACGATRDDTAVLTATVSSSVLLEGTPAPEWRVVTRSDELGVCSGASTAADGVRLSFSKGMSVVVNADGVPLAPEPLETVVGLSRPVLALRTVVPGWQVAVDFGGSLFIAPVATASTTFTQVHGPELFDRRRISAVTAHDGGFTTFSTGRRATRVRFDEASGAPTLMDLNLEGFGREDQVDAAVVLEGGATHVVAGHTDTQPWLRRVQPDGTSTEIPLAGLVPDDTYFTDMTQVAPELLVITAEDGGLFRLTGDVLEAIPLLWDDPFTDDIETRPIFMECRERRAFERDERRLFNAVDGSHSVAWVVGCAAVVFRVVAVGAAPYAQRVVLTRPPQTLFNGTTRAPSLTAVRAFCPDNVIFGSQGRNEIENAKGRIFEVIPEEPGQKLNAGQPFDDVLIRDYPPNETINSGATELDRGRPVILMGSGERVSVVFGQGSDVMSTFGRYGQEVRLGFAREIRAAAQLPRGDVLLGGRHGQMIYGRQCDAP